jgi:alpha-glucosidase
MQWANAPNGGFSPPGVQTWLPVNANHAQGVNVAEQLEDPDSLLSFYRRLLRVRKENPALIAGDYTPLHEDAEDYFAFLRDSPADGQACLVVLNTSDRAHRLSFDLDVEPVRAVFSSRDRVDETERLSDLFIAPFEVYVGVIKVRCT